MRAFLLIVLAALATAAEPAVVRVWARATAAGAEAGGVFAEIAGGAAGDRLLSAESAAARTVEVHEHAKGADGVMAMRAVPGGVAVPAGGTLLLKPGSYHIMLIGLVAPLRKGARVPVTFVLERAGRVQVEAEVLDPWAMAFDER